MTTIRQAAPLTVEAYETYKKNNFSAETIMEAHGMDTDHFSEWLEANKLKGKRFIASSSSVDSNTLINILKNDSEGVYDAFRPPYKQILTNLVERPSVALDADNRISLIEVERNESIFNTAWLEERHVQDTDIINNLRAELEKEKARGDRFCDEIVETRRKLVEENAKVINLTAQIKRQDELLIAADRDRKLLFMTMEKATELNKQIQASVEGGEF